MTDTRLARLDVLRCLATLGVALIHGTAVALDAFLQAHAFPADFWILIVFNQLARFCVPAFFVLSGFLAVYKDRITAGRTQPASPQLIRRVFKLVVPYFFWSILFSLAFNLENQKLTPELLLNNLLWGQSFWGGYFIIALLELTVLHTVIVRGFQRPIRLFVIVFGLAVMTEVIFYIAAWGGSSLPARAFQAGLGYYKSTLLPWVSFYVLGIFLAYNYARASQVLRKIRWCLILVMLATLTLSVVESAVLFEATHSLAIASDYFKISSVIYALAVTGLCFGWESQVTRFTPFVTRIATASYGIYYLNDRLILILIAVLPILKTNPLFGQPILVIAGIMLPTLAYAYVTRRAPDTVRLVMFGISTRVKVRLPG
jgi:probable poly-beta-1,6-N-acetyl-D-glucosamine export protein